MYFKYGDKLQVVLGGAVTTNHLDCTVNFRNCYGGEDRVDNGQAATNNTTAVDLMAPPQGYCCALDHLFVHNNDTVQAVVTIQVVINGSTRKVKTETLQPGQTLEWSR